VTRVAGNSRVVSSQQVDQGYNSLTDLFLSEEAKIGNQEAFRKLKVRFQDDFKSWYNYRHSYSSSHRGLRIFASCQAQWHTILGQRIYSKGGKVEARVKIHLLYIGTPSYFAQKVAEYKRKLSLLYVGTPGSTTSTSTTHFHDPIRQSNWRWCNKCQGLFFAGHNQGSCPAGGSHNHGGSWDYTLLANQNGYSQSNWRWCNKCQGLFFAGHNQGSCPAGGSHNHGGSWDYTVLHNGTQGLSPGSSSQSNWRWCNKCQGLFFAGHNQGSCPAGGSHNHGGSWDYSLVHN